MNEHRLSYAHWVATVTGTPLSRYFDRRVNLLNRLTATEYLAKWCKEEDDD
jgi:hypothetical protein